MDNDKLDNPSEVGLDSTPGTTSEAGLVIMQADFIRQQDFIRL